jgi:hypothetical protein
MELAFYRGDMPAAAEVVYAGIGDGSLADSLVLFGEIAERTTSTPGESQQTASAVVARLRRQMGPDLPRVARSIDPDVARRAVDLYVRLADDSDRSLARTIGDAVLELLEEARHR